MKSAYEMSHRSWFWLSSRLRRRATPFSLPGYVASTGLGGNALLGGFGGFLLVVGLGAAQIRELLRDQIGVLAFLDPERTFHHQLELRDFGLVQELELRRGRQEHEVGETDAVDRGHERHGDALSDRADVREVLHHVDEAHHGTDDADRRRVTTGRFPYLGRPLAVLVD